MHDGPHEDDGAARLEAAFVEGFHAATDKQAFLRLAGIPFDLEHVGDPSFKLVEVHIAENWTVGAVSPSFGGADLTHHPLPASMIENARVLSFVYVSAETSRSISLADLSESRAGDPG
jgi:hypothetical protein